MFKIKFVFGHSQLSVYLKKNLSVYNIKKLQKTF